MAKRTTPTPGPADAAQPEPAPGSAMTEPASAPAASPADVTAPVPAEAVAAPAGGASSAEPGTDTTAGAWPDVSSAPTGPRCPWCSAALPSDDLVTCPSCGAQLNGPTEAEVPGVTTIDVAALAWKAGAPPRRSKIMSWISGDSDDEVESPGGSSAAVEPPSLAVRREMLRLELEAEGISLPHDAEPSVVEEAAAETTTEAAGTTAEAAQAAEVAGPSDAGTEAPGG